MQLCPNKLTPLAIMFRETLLYFLQYIYHCLLYFPSVQGILCIFTHSCWYLLISLLWCFPIFYCTLQHMSWSWLADHCFKLNPQNHDNLGNMIGTWSPRGTVIHIEVLVVGASIILLFMATFGYWRRQSRNFFIQKETSSPSMLSFILDPSLGYFGP